MQSKFAKVVKVKSVFLFLRVQVCESDLRYTRQSRPFIVSAFLSIKAENKSNKKKKQNSKCANFLNKIYDLGRESRKVFCLRSRRWKAFLCYNKCSFSDEYCWLSSRLGIHQHCTCDVCVYSESHICPYSVSQSFPDIRRSFSD